MPQPQTSRRSGKGERLEARVTLEQKRLIARAARLRGTSITDFVVLSAQQAAAEALHESAVLRLHDEQRDVFIRALLRPPAPNAAAKAAARRYNRRSRS